MTSCWKKLNQNGITSDIKATVSVLFKNLVILEINVSYTEKRQTEREYHGCETVSSLTPKNWELIPNSLKEEMLLAVFKNTFKNFDNFPMPLPTL